MAGTWRVVLTMGCLAWTAATASAFEGRFGYRPSYVVACMPAPIQVYCVPALPYSPVKVAPVPQASPGLMPRAQPLSKPIAKPQQAPPSSSKEPPLSGGPSSGEEPLRNPLRAPTITESRSLGSVEQAGARLAEPGRCKVGFWNVTGRDLTLTIDGQARTLAKDRAVTVTLGRTFVWQISGRDAQTERVPEELGVYEVILRPER